MRAKGISFIVLKLSVISSPTVPSPRVAPTTNEPFSYLNDADTPSIFGSETISMSRAISKDRNFVTRNKKSLTSVSSKALASDNIGSRCVTLEKAGDGVAPTRVSLGLNCCNAGNRCTSPSSLRLNLS